jgi:5'-3' exonuclease
MIFSRLQSDRDATPEAIKIAFRTFKNYFAMHIYNRSKGYEVDDLIGTIAKQAEKRKLQSLYGNSG